MKVVELLVVRHKHTTSTCYLLGNSNTHINIPLHSKTRLNNKYYIKQQRSFQHSTVNNLEKSRIINKKLSRIEHFITKYETH